MKIRHNKFDLTGDDGEVITVAVSPITPPPLPPAEVITYVLNGKPWAGGSFTLDKNVFGVFKLSIMIVYKGKSGGGATIKVTGSHGGDVSTDPEAQAPEEPYDAPIYRFTIL